MAQLLFYDPLRLMPTLWALDGADFQTLEGIRRSSNQMRIAAALAAGGRWINPSKGTRKAVDDAEH
jgi:hypothetical protein